MDPALQAAHRPFTVAKAASISFSVLAVNTSKCRPRASAARGMSVWMFGLPGFTSKEMVRAVGTNSSRSSKRFGSRTLKDNISTGKADVGNWRRGYEAALSGRPSCVPKATEIDGITGKSFFRQMFGRILLRHPSAAPTPAGRVPAAAPARFRGAGGGRPCPKRFSCFVPWPFGLKARPGAPAPPVEVAPRERRWERCEGLRT